ncbi:translin [Bacillus rossius redtenbacheri]|uniref:translin n=1 Tax=Bacillus rossius redtenbacheri TaxID=93214 RepID=UPI002FDE3AAD
MSYSVNNIFTAFQEYLNSDQDLREEIRTIVKDIEQSSREMLTTLQRIHSEGGQKEIAAICSDARKLLGPVRGGFAKLSEKIPYQTYYRYNDHWRFATQRLTFLVSLIIYLETSKLATREEAAQALGVQIERENGFHLDLEDYLFGLLQLSSELSRLAVNSVTYGDYARPIELSRFVTELNAGFRLLNLKNDNLRKRFDALKYDVKKIEEVVYDLTIRGLKPELVAQQASSHEEHAGVVLQQ